MSRDEGGFRMVPVAVGVDFGTSNSVVAIADRSGQVRVRRFDTQVNESGMVRGVSGGYVDCS
jgi:molecular chaperone DnaK (HSP70)